mgnify:CR=1 FL=1
MGRCEKLKWNRRKLGMTQKDLADKIGISVSTISKLETDETAWATVRDTTDNAISDILHKLGSWQCDIESVFDKHLKKEEKTEELNISELRKRLKEKRLSLGMSQKDLGLIVGGIDHTTISKYENHDNTWNGGTDNETVNNSIRFIEGEYITGYLNVHKEDAVHEPPVDECVILPEESNDDVTDDINIGNESVENTLNNIIDILQDKLSADDCTPENTNLYVSMIIGLCNGYLQR